MAGTTGGTARRARAVGAPGAVAVAPYALVRTVALAAPEPSPDASAYRECARRLVELTALCERVRSELCDSLYDVAGAATPEVRSRVLVPLRRDVHNRRAPKDALRAALAGLGDRPPLLDTWLSATDGIGRLGERLAVLGGPALRADRDALAGLCRSEELQRAVALTSEDLLYAVRRAAAGGGEPDKQCRKSEATVLRYAMRAVTRTNPLSWFSQVGWGRWQEGPGADGTGPADTGPADTGAADSGPADTGPAGPFAVARVQRSLSDALVQAVLRRPEVRAEADCRLAPGLYVDGSHLSYRRAAEGDGAAPDPVREERITLPLTAPLRLVLTRGDGGSTLRQREVAADIARRLPGPPDRAERAAADFVASLVGQGLLQPVPPFDPQAQDVAGEASRWLAGLGLPGPARVLAAIGADTETYPLLPAAARPARLARLRSRWAEAFSLLGAAPASPRAPLTEDVVLRSVAALGPRHGGGALPELARLGPLFELFDASTLLRRMTRDRFVDRFGAGGTCASLARFADEMAEVRAACDDLAPDGALHRPGDGRPAVSPQVRDLLRLRAELAAAVPVVESSENSGDSGDSGEVVLPEDLLDRAAQETPAWVRQRPASYAVFAQPVPDGAATRLCVNRVYGGWGRFTSRFLGHLDPGAGRQVAERIAAALGEGERVAQVRPVGGFNANLHPLLVADEVSEAAPWATLRPEQLDLFHDTAADQLRLRVAATGEPVSVLYLGFLLPSVLPDRWTPLVNDLDTGPVDLGNALAPSRPRQTALGPIGHRPRLRHRGVILSRAQWRLPEEAVRAWCAELDREPPVRATARRRALLGLPEHVFVAAAAPGDAAGPGALRSYLAQPKSQYVDLGSALHLRCLARTLARCPDGVVVREALPVPTPGARAVEVVAETYRSRP